MKKTARRDVRDLSLFPSLEDSIQYGKKIIGFNEENTVQNGRVEVKSCKTICPLDEEGRRLRKVTVRESSIPMKIATIELEEKTKGRLVSTIVRRLASKDKIQYSRTQKKLMEEIKLTYPKLFKKYLRINRLKTLILKVSKALVRLRLFRLRNSFFIWLKFYISERLKAKKKAVASIQTLVRRRIQRQKFQEVIQLLHTQKLNEEKFLSMIIARRMHAATVIQRCLRRKFAYNRALLLYRKFRFFKSVKQLQNAYRMRKSLIITQYLRNRKSLNFFSARIIQTAFRIYLSKKKLIIRKIIMRSNIWKEGKEKKYQLMIREFVILGVVLRLQRNFRRKKNRAFKAKRDRKIFLEKVIFVQNQRRRILACRRIALKKHMDELNSKEKIAVMKLQEFARKLARRKGIVRFTDVFVEDFPKVNRKKEKNSPISVRALKKRLNKLKIDIEEGLFFKYDSPRTVRENAASKVQATFSFCNQLAGKYALLPVRQVPDPLGQRYVPLSTSKIVCRKCFHTRKNTFMRESAQLEFQQHSFVSTKYCKRFESKQRDLRMTTALRLINERNRREKMEKHITSLKLKSAQLIQREFRMYKLRLISTERKKSLAVYKQTKEKSLLTTGESVMVCGKFQGEKGDNWILYYSADMDIQERDWVLLENNWYQVVALNDGEKPDVYLLSLDYPLQNRIFFKTGKRRRKLFARKQKFLGWKRNLQRGFQMAAQKAEELGS
eukprot:augustus_masked-scaffold_4-processed-gene-7.18-mRNA-1 protein AED:1.00 eAED:1.00 QI:0/0/0/0/1/1/2/0/721